MKIQRLTTKREKGYSAPDIQETIDRLGRLEDLYEALYAEQDRITADMERLSQAGRTKSATYRQYMGNKLLYRQLLSMYELYGLKERE